VVKKENMEREEFQSRKDKPQTLRSWRRETGSGGQNNFLPASWVDFSWRKKGV
jgi:hypothetical protein